MQPGREAFRGVPAVEPGVISTLQARGPSHKVLARVACVLLLAGCLAGILTPAGLGWDFANFYDTGRRVVAGQLADIYDASTPIAGAAPAGKLDFYGAPISAYLYAPLGLAAPRTALLLFKVENAIALLLALVLLYRFGRREVSSTPGAGDRYAARFAWAALLFQPFWTVFRVGGQTTPTVFLLLTLGLLAHVRGRVGWSSFWFVAAVAIKPAFALGFLFLAAIAGLKFVGWSAVHGLWVGGLSVLVAGWSLHLEFLRKMAANAGAAARWIDNSSIWTVPHELFGWLAAHGADPTSVERFVGIVLRLAIVAGMGALAWWARRRTLPASGRAYHEWVLAMVFFLLFAQTAWEHYLSVLFFIVSFWMAHWDEAPGGLRRGIIALVGLSVLQNLVLTRALVSIFGFDSLPALILATLVKSAPTLVAVWLLARHRGDWEAIYRRGLAG